MYTRVRPFRSGGLQNKIRVEGRVGRAAHHGTQEHRLEIIIVIGQMSVGLAECGHDLRHVHLEKAIGIGQRRAVALRVTLVTFCRVRPDLDTLPGQRCAIAGAAASIITAARGNKIFIGNGSIFWKNPGNGSSLEADMGNCQFPMRKQYVSCRAKNRAAQPCNISWNSRHSRALIPLLS